jgi:drug/metabolite transporter (DMT)-like permease
MRSRVLVTFSLLLVAMALTVTGEVLLKVGMNRIGDQFALTPRMLAHAFSHWQVFCGFVLIFSGSLFWLYVISRFDLSYAYPLLAFNYVLILIPSWVLLGERVTMNKVIGSLIIVLGVIVVTWRGK